MRTTFFLLAVTFLAAPSFAYAINPAQLLGARIVSENGRYLGKVASIYDGESIANAYSSYGTIYSSDSIWNQYGDFGSRYHSMSAFNPYASTPPKIIGSSGFLAYLTVNTSLSPRISADDLRDYLKR